MCTMSFINFFLSTLVLVLFSSSSNIIHAQPLGPENAATIVLDEDGQPVQTATKYYILPAVKGSGNGGGGLSLSSRDGMCPFYVMQANHQLSNGLPLRFLAMNNNSQKNVNISLSSDVNVVFHAATICVQSTGWRVGGADEITGRRYVKSGGMTGRPGSSTVSNWFKVEKYDDIESGDDGYYYKIVFCPSVCSECKVVCGNVGVFLEDGKRWLGLSDDTPLIVSFKKA